MFCGFDLPIILNLNMIFSIFFKIKKNEFWRNLIKIPRLPIIGRSKPRIFFISPKLHGIPRVPPFKPDHIGPQNVPQMNDIISWNSAGSTWPKFSTPPPVHSDPHLLTSDKIDDHSPCPLLPKNISPTTIHFSRLSL